MHYIITKRKQRKWVTFGGTHKKLASMPSDFLSAAEWAALKSAYTNVLVSRGLGSDNIRFELGYGYAELDRFDRKGSTQFLQSRLQLTL